MCGWNPSQSASTWDDLLFALVWYIYSSSIGVELLKKMGWKEGQGVGPRVKRRASRQQPGMQSLTWFPSAQRQDQSVVCVCACHDWLTDWLHFFFVSIFHSLFFRMKKASKSTAVRCPLLDQRSPRLVILRFCSSHCGMNVLELH